MVFFGRKRPHPLEDVPDDKAGPYTGMKFGDYRLLEQEEDRSRLIEFYRAVPEAAPDSKAAVTVGICAYSEWKRDALVQSVPYFESLCGVKHPGLFALLTVGKHDDLLYLVGERATGTPLVDWLNTEPALPLRLGALVPLIGAVATLHVEGSGLGRLRRRDILITETGGRLHLLGCAEAFYLLHRRPHEAGSFSDPEELGYLAPETLTGLHTTPKADQFQLGGLVYETVTGRLPFASEDVMEQIAGVLTRDPEPMGPEAGALLEETVMRMLEKEPEKRFPDLTEVLDRLRPLAQLPSPQTDPDSRRCRGCNWLNPPDTTVCAVCGGKIL